MIREWYSATRISGFHPVKIWNQTNEWCFLFLRGICWLCPRCGEQFLKMTTIFDVAHPRCLRERLPSLSFCPRSLLKYPAWPPEPLRAWSGRHFLARQGTWWSLSFMVGWMASGGESRIKESVRIPAGRYSLNQDLCAFWCQPQRFFPLKILEEII